MTARWLLALAFWPAAVMAADKSQWLLETGELRYFADHALHKTHAVSRAVKGKGLCDATGCHFLAAAPVKSFDSGDSNRDLHMWEATRGVQHPMVVVKVELPAVPSAPQFQADLEVQFAGETVRYPRVPFTVADRSGGLWRVTGTVPLTLKDFKIPPPSLLGLAVKNDVPVRVDLRWKKM